MAKVKQMQEMITPKNQGASKKNASATKAPKKAAKEMMKAKNK